MEIGNFKNIEYLDISKNMFFGKIPTSLTSCAKLEFLDMRRLFFEGEFLHLWNHYEVLNI